MAKKNFYRRMTEDDLRAARVLTLAVKFFGTSRPVSSSSIRSDLYPGIDDSAFKRQFLRDRELLGSFGIVIREVVSTDADTLWQVDEHHSYVKGDGLGPNDARMLYILCHDMAFDQAFPYRDELRIALAKISRMYRGAAIAHDDQASPAEHKLLATLISCMSNFHAADVTYTDANGNTSKRTLALLGSFGLHDHTYFVASRIVPKGDLVPDSMRIYRLDRFERVRELPDSSYQIPLDFSVNDYERLPFQIGDSIGQACFLVDHVESKRVTRAMAMHGSICQDDGSSVWEVPYSDAQIAASWAVGSGIMPKGPQELIDAWHHTIAAAAQTDPHEQGLESWLDTEQASESRKRAGRKGSVTTARQLVALASSLTKEGEVITAQDIATTLGVSFDEARHLIALVTMGSGESIDYLPLIMSDQDDEVALMEGAMLSARSIRLTRSETIALRAALTEIGVDENDPLVQTLSNAYAAPSFSEEDIARSFESPSSSSDTPVLKQCSKAISAGMGLTFTYLPVTGGPESRRRVVPQTIRRNDDNWYLDAFDLMRLGPRVFRIDRMSELGETPVKMPVASMRTQSADKRMVVVRFLDPRYLEIFPWDEIQKLAEDGEGIIVRMPLYAGTWLARHLVACAGTVQVSDRTLATQMSDYVQELQAKELPKP